MKKMRPQKERCVWRFVETFYFLVSIVMLSFWISFDLQEYSTRKSPETTGIYGDVFQFTVPFLFLGGIVLTRCFIQRRWLEMSSPALYAGSAYLRVILHVGAVQDELVYGIILHSGLVLLNFVLLMRTLCQFLFIKFAKDSKDSETSLE